MLSLGHIIDSLAQRPLGGQQVITDVVIDSRRAIPGALFVALPGEHGDGHDFVGDAFQRGAVAALTQREVTLPDDSHVYTLDLRQPVTQEQAQELSLPAILRVDDCQNALQQVARDWRTRFGDIRVIGITGSVGKTTTKELIAEVLAERYSTLSSEASFNNEIGLPLTVLRMSAEHERVVLEMGMYDVGEISMLCDIAKPQVGVVTIIGTVHMERAGSIERIVQAKAELVEALPPGPDGVAILNIDDERVIMMAERTEADVVTYGVNPEADVWAERVEGLGVNGIRFWLHHEGKRAQVQVPMLGRHSVHTALRAAAVGLVEGMEWRSVVKGLQSSASQLRLVAVEGPDGSILLDDTYNATPESVIAALNLLDDLEGRRVAVLGDMRELGAYEVPGHRRVALRARQVADELVTVGELGALIAKAAIEGGMPASRVHEMADNDEVIAYLMKQVGKGDVVLVKGSRSMQMEQIVSALSDKEQA